MAVCAIADSFRLTPKQQEQMLEEADDWIDDMPEGLQDRLADAVNHAMHGFTSELEYMRNLSDTTGYREYKVRIEDFNDGPLSYRLYSPTSIQEGKKMPLLIYFHGGGWTMGDIKTSEKFCRALAATGQMQVASVDYPLAPENPYPHAILKGEKATEYIIQKVGSTSVSLGGDGAGGNLALEIYNRLPVSDKIKSIVLYYPILDSKGETDAISKRKYGRGYGFDSRLFEAFKESYKGDYTDLKKTLPPTLLICSGRDILIQSQEDFSKVGNVKYVVFTGAIHGFITDGHQKTAFEKAVELTEEIMVDGL